MRLSEVVNPDCTGYATGVDASGPLTGQADHISFVVVESGGEIKVIVANPGAVFTGTADKQPIDAD